MNVRSFRKFKFKVPALMTWSSFGEMGHSFTVSEEIMYQKKNSRPKNSLSQIGYRSNLIG